MNYAREVILFEQLPEYVRQQHRAARARYELLAMNFVKSYSTISFLLGTKLSFVTSLAQPGPSLVRLRPGFSARSELCQA
jgi:hypothetical protein